MAELDDTRLRGLAKRFGLEHRLRRKSLERALLQCGLATIVVLIVLMVLDSVTQTVLIAALGSSTFIAFALPRSQVSAPRHLVGGYAVGIAAGCLMSVLDSVLLSTFPGATHAVTVTFGALAIGLAMLLMVVTKTEHPPAAALALGLVLNQWDGLTLAVIIGGIMALSLMKSLILPLLMDLL